MDRVIFLIIILFLFSPLGAGAAVLYLEPTSGEYHQGDTFIANVRIDPEKECVNVVQADLEFSKDVLEVKDFSKGNSIISFWVGEPEFSNETGFISFAGGIPGGFCGFLLGDPGESNLLGKIIFQVKNLGGQSSEIATLEFLGSSQVLLNDGAGTPAKLTAKGSAIKITEVEATAILKNEWQKELEKDKVPPEPFEIQINQDVLTFEGRYFITFQSQDKQTGVDHYEVKEGRKDWKIGEAPYLLEDQEIKGTIKVKAVDKAGNERIAEYRPAEKFSLSLWWLLGILAGIAVIWRLIKISNLKSQISK